MVELMDSRLPCRFWSKVSPDPVTGCWLWTGSNNGVGYGEYQHDGKKQYAHRVAYMIFVGPIPPGLELDHVKSRGCTSRSCCNPAHLEAVTRTENIIRGDVGKVNRERHVGTTHCPSGHPYQGDNLYVRPGGGSRGCRKCRADAANRYFATHRSKHGPLG